MGDWSWSDEQGWLWSNDEPTEATPVTEPLSIDVPDELWPVPTADPPRTATATVRSAAEVLTAAGIIRGPEVVELAAAAGLELAAAATLLQKESGGGRNVWGSDPVQTGGLYVKGAQVTQAAYTSYKAYRSRLGYQGVGPCQLTYGPLQDMADRIGGCWDWRANVTIGFRLLAGYIKANGVRTGFRIFNGSGAAAERYADDAIAKYGKWQALLGGTTTGDEDLTPEEHSMLAAVFQQMSGSTDVTKWPGWPSFKGGSGYSLTLLDYLRQADVQLQTAKSDIVALQSRAETAPVSAPAELSEDDVRRIVTSMLEQLVASWANRGTGT